MLAVTVMAIGADRRPDVRIFVTCSIGCKTAVKVEAADIATQIQAPRIVAGWRDAIDRPAQSARSET